MRDGGRGSGGGRQRTRTQTTLVVAEVALAFVLLAGAALFITSFSSMTTFDPGFSAENRLMVRVVLPSRYRDSEDASLKFFEALTRRFASIPGVRSVAHAGQIPFGTGWSFPPASIESSEGIIEDSVHTTSVSPEYFPTMNVPSSRDAGSPERIGKAAYR